MCAAFVLNAGQQPYFECFTGPCSAFIWANLESGGRQYKIPFNLPNSIKVRLSHILMLCGIPLCPCSPSNLGMNNYFTSNTRTLGSLHKDGQRYRLAPAWSFRPTYRYYKHKKKSPRFPYRFAKSWLMFRGYIYNSKPIRIYYTLCGIQHVPAAKASCQYKTDSTIFCNAHFGWQSVLMPRPVSYSARHRMPRISCVVETTWYDFCYC